MGFDVFILQMMKTVKGHSAFWRAVVLGVVFVSVGLILTLWGARSEYRPTREALTMAWPPMAPPYVVLVVDPECPMCRRLESDLRARGEKLPIRYLPALGHARSREMWLAKAESWGLSSVWVDSAWEEVRKGGAVSTPITIAVSLEGVKVLVGYAGYERWRSWVAESLGL